MNKIEILNAKEVDNKLIEEFKKSYTKPWSGLYNLLRLDVDLWKKALEMDTNTECLCLIENNKLVGIARISKVVELDSIGNIDFSILPDMRHRYLGSILLGAINLYCKENNINEKTVVTLSTNIAGRELLRKNGWVQLKSEIHSDGHLYTTMYKD